MRGRRSSSAAVRVLLGLREARRVKRTSVGVCSREDVMINMFSGEKVGRVEMK